MTNDEIWKPFPRYADRYSVSSSGRVRNDRSGLIRVLSTTCGGYLRLSMYREGKRETVRVHRAICEALHGPCPPGMECRHLDGNPQNNRAENLSWGTPSENQQDSILHGTAGSRKGELHGMTRLGRERVVDAQMRYMSHMSRRRSEGFVQAKAGFFRSLVVELGVTAAAAQFILKGQTWKSEYAEAKRGLER